MFPPRGIRSLGALIVFGGLALETWRSLQGGDSTSVEARDFGIIRSSTQVPGFAVAHHTAGQGNLAAINIDPRQLHIQLS